MGLNADSPRRRRPSWPLVLLVVAAAACLLAILSRADIAGRQPPHPVRPDQDTDVRLPVVKTPSPETEAATDPRDTEFDRLCQRMVDGQLAGRDITDRRVLDAMRRIPRHKFVPDDLRDMAYADRPLPIGHEQTISQPYIVALMTQLARTKRDARALDIGTGSGYQAAVLAELVQRVYSIEILCPLADSARQRLKSLGYTNIEVTCGDGYQGLPKQAPFDLIIVAAAPDHVPKPLVQQLAPGGRLVIPVGRFFQNLLVIEKLADGTLRKENVAPVAFVPMTGEAQRR